jgi:hypothetical protein
VLHQLWISIHSVCKALPAKSLAVVLILAVYSVVARSRVPEVPQQDRISNNTVYCCTARFYREWCSSGNNKGCRIHLLKVAEIFLIKETPEPRSRKSDSTTGQIPTVSINVSAHPEIKAINSIAKESRFHFFLILID